MDLETIETRRLRLVGLSPENMKYIFDNLSKPEIKKILGHRSEVEFLQEEIKHKNGYSSYNRGFILFLLTEKETEQIIGRCGIHNWNKEHKRAEIGYVMHDDNSKRKGLMTEAMNAILNYGFINLQLNRIEALVGIGNIPSLKLMDRFKFKNEGTLRQHYRINGKFEDTFVFSKLHSEFINAEV